MSGIERLRDYAYDKTKSRYERVELCDIANEIESDMKQSVDDTIVKCFSDRGVAVDGSNVGSGDRRFVRLPVDIDGKPVMTGDWLIWRDDEKPSRVDVLSWYGDDWWEVWSEKGNLVSDSICSASHCDAPVRLVDVKEEIIRSLMSINYTTLRGDNLEKVVDGWMESVEAALKGAM